VLLPVVQQIVTDANFTEEELATYKQNSKQKLSVNLQKCDFVANRLIDAAVYGNSHPYGKYSVAADYDALNTIQLKNHYHQHYINGHCVLFVAGKLPIDIQVQLNNNFGNLPLKNHKTATTYVQIKNEEIQVNTAVQKTTVTNDENGVQAAIRIARPFPNRHHPDFQKIMVLNTLFGGFFGSRLMSNIREDKGYTYGIHSYIQNHIGNTAWMISTEAGKDVSAATIEEVYKEMELLQTELIDEEELLLVRNYMIGIILGDLDGPFQIIGRWKNLVLNNLDADYFYNSINTIKTISAEELRELAKKYLNPTHFNQLVVI
jgi:predicted Zn-dependent peptidase